MLNTTSTAQPLPRCFVLFLYPRSLYVSMRYGIRLKREDLKLKHRKIYIIKELYRLLQFKSNSHVWKFNVVFTKICGKVLAK